MARLSEMIRKGVEAEKARPDKTRESESTKDQKSRITLRNITELQSAKTSHSSQLKQENEAKIAVNKKKTADEYAKLYNEAYNYILKCGSIVKQREKIDLKEGAQIIAKMTKDPLGIEMLYGKAILSKDNMDQVASNMVNVGIYSIKLGVGLKFSKEKLIALGVAGLLHDLGMFLAPEKVLTKEDKLSDQEFAEIKKHPIQGYNIIKQLGDKYIWLAEVLLQEHEREGGQGYPEGLKGDAIKEYAKIVGLADVFEGLTHKRPQRERMLPYDATKKILAEAKGLYDVNIVKVLLQKLGCFPLESYVKLSSNAIAKVVDVNERFPLRPTVEIIFDPHGNRVQDKKTVKLQENTLVHITGSVYEEDLPQDDHELI